MSELTVINYEGLEIVFDGISPMLTQAQMAELFEVSQSAVAQAIRRAAERGFIDLESVYDNLSYTAADGKTYTVKHYHMKAVLLVGFRLQEATPRVIAFQDWVTNLVEGHINDVMAERDRVRRRLESTQYELHYAQEDYSSLLSQTITDRYPEED